MSDFANEPFDGRVEGNACEPRELTGEVGGAGEPPEERAGAQ